MLIGNCDFYFPKKKESIYKWHTICVIPRLKGIYCHKNKRRRSKNICFLLRTAERNYNTRDPYKFWIVRNRVLLSRFTVPPSPQRLKLSRPLTDHNLCSWFHISEQHRSTLSSGCPSPVTFYYPIHSVPFCTDFIGFWATWKIAMK